MKETKIKVELLQLTPEPSKLIEEAGRTAYLSFDKKEDGTDKKFVKMLLKRGHESVIEHGWMSIRVSGVSRSFSHQLVRHRLCSFTQQSQRYVDESNFNVVVPETIKDNEEALKVYKILKEKAPVIVQDFEIQKNGEGNEYLFKHN